MDYHLSFKDKLMTVSSETSSGGSSGNWLFKNKEHGKASAAASLVRKSCSWSLILFTQHYFEANCFFVPF